ncbi:MAG: LLM class flavin-dependent oxidoreductase [Pseudomonadota bacterium]
MQLGLSPDQTHPDFSEMCHQSKMAESLGFSALWVHEHHSAGMMYPDPLMALAVLAPITATIRLGTSMLLLPLHHPVRMAQSAAMVDVMSGGRLDLGIANGYAATDLAAFGMTGKHRGRRVQQGVELARQLWTGESVTASGEGFELQDFVLFPPPVQRPGPPLLLGGHAPVAIERAARLGDGFFISATTGLELLTELISQYRGLLEELGRRFEGVWLNRVACVVDSARQKAEARDFFASALLGLYDDWGHDNVARLTERERRIDEICRNNLLIGEPAEVLEQVEMYREMGVRHIACLTSFGAPPVDVARRSITLLGEAVIPKLA